MEKGHEVRATEQTKRLIQQDKDVPLGNPGLAHLDRSERTYSNARDSAATHDNLAGHASGEAQKWLLDNRIHGPPKITSIPGRAGTQRSRTPAAYADQFDEVVFGRNTDGSAPGSRTDWKKTQPPDNVVAGVSSAKQVRQEEWLPTKEDHTPITGKKKIGRVANAGVVDKVVFSCDIDNSGDALADLQAQPEFWGASGCPTAALGDQASRKHAGARMHLPPEFRHADPESDASLQGEKGQLHAFGFDQDQPEHVERAERAPAFQNCAGSTSGKINEQTTHQCYGEIRNARNAAVKRVYDVQAAPTEPPVVLLSAGHLEDSELAACTPGGVLSRDQVAQFSVGMAGQSSIDRNKASEAYDRRERGRAIVPRRESKIADFINPSPQSFGFVKEQEQKNKDLFSRQLYPADRRKQPAGLPANETNENAYREMVHLDGDSRQAKRIEADDRSAYGEDEGPPRLSAQMSILGQDADARRPDYRVHQ